MLDQNEFTEKAMQMARERMERERADSGNYFEREEPKYSVPLYLSDKDLQLLYRLMDLGVSKSKEAITRCKRFPTDSIRSQMTIEKHDLIIDHIETLRAHLVENSLR